MSRRPARVTAAAQRRPGRSRLCRWRARWLVALALAAQLCSLAHALLVRHARCEHGELVHAATVAVAASTRRAHRRPPGDRLGARPGGGDDQCDALAPRHEGDEHCDAFALRGQLGAPVHRVAEATLIEVVRLASIRPSPEVRPIPLLILAPKSSPPAA
ncbi:hypothetical protein WME90_36810 [Sorangium sp. So ce375]|uniref:hypothetical protein n=1 Tax=Sorangium sp. So ce375 TaxID=3133306 RepID=UPI003F5BBBA1